MAALSGGISLPAKSCASAPRPPPGIVPALAFPSLFRPRDFGLALFGEHDDARFALIEHGFNFWYSSAPRL